MREYPEAAVERAMKVHEVILRAMAKRITWWQAAEILGISDRSMRRWRTRMEEDGFRGVFDRRIGHESAKRVSVETIDKVLSLYRDQYFDFNVKHFHEKRTAEHGIDLSYTWVKRTLQAAGLAKKASKRGCHRRRRPRRPLPGMLLHLDGSHHQWFQDDRWYDLIVVMDDATSEIYYAQLVDDESTTTVMAALKQVVEDQGWFCALYSDRANGTVLFTGGRTTAAELYLPPLLTFDRGGVRPGESFTATFSGISLNNGTYYDLRFDAPGESTEYVAPNWQRGLSATHSVGNSMAIGTWTVTGVRPHQSIDDHTAAFVSVSVELLVEQ
jgi:transposase